MRDSDLADSPLASYRPDIAGDLDSLPDYLREKVAECEAPLPRTVAERTEQFFAIIAAGLKEMDMEECTRRAGAGAEMEITVGVLRLLSREPESALALRAACLLRLLGKDGRSFQQLADDYGITGVNARACPHAIYRKLQKQTGLRGRGDKSDSAREKSRRVRLGKKRQRFSLFPDAWNCALQLPLPTPALAFA